MAEIDEAIARLTKLSADYARGSRGEALIAHYHDATFSDLALLLSHVEAMRWRPIEEAPAHQEVLVYRDDAGVFTAIHTSLVGLGIEDEQMSEDALFNDDWFTNLTTGVSRVSNDGLPTHFMPLPKGPSDD